MTVPGTNHGGCDDISFDRSEDEAAIDPAFFKQVRGARPVSAVHQRMNVERAIHDSRDKLQVRSVRRNEVKTDIRD